MDLYLPERELKLIVPQSRVLRAGEIHELVLVSDPNAGPGSTVRGGTYLCFFEVVEGGVVTVGDVVYLRGIPLCVIRGFDETHMPNHINIACYTEQPRTGREIGLILEEELILF